MRPGGEMDDHASLLTRCSGFESWPGHRSCVREVPSSSGEDIPLTWGRAVVRVHPGPLGERRTKGDWFRVNAMLVPSRLSGKFGRATRSGDGTRLESGRALSLAGSTP